MLSDRGDVQLILAEAGVDAGAAGRRHDPRRRQAALRRDLDRGVLRPHLPRHPGGLELRLAAVRRRDGALARYILLAALKVPVLDGLLGKISREFDKIDADGDRRRGSTTCSPARSRAAPRRQPPRPAPTAPRRGPAATARWPSTRPTSPQRARDGKIDPVIGRDPEIRQIVDILMRRRQNNPILTGEAGVGKTAVVEGFALRLAAGRRAADAAGTSACSMLDIGLMQAGASVKGEFEKRLRVGDRRGAGLRDADHPLHRRGAHADRRRRRGRHRRRRQPPEAGARARRAPHHRRHHLGRVQAAHREGPGADPPLPGGQGRGAGRGGRGPMLRGVAGVLEKHHEVQILDEAIEAAVSLSHRYIPARQLPDKAVSLLDTACARVAVSQHATPGRGRGPAPPPADARGRGRHHRPRGGDRHRRRRRAARASTPALAETAAALAAAEARWERENGARRRRSSTLRARLRGEGVPLDAATAAGARRGRRTAEDRPRRRAGRAERRAADPRRRPRRAARADGRARRRPGRDAARSCPPSTATPSPRWCRTGPASPPAGCSPARPRRRCASPRSSPSASSARTTRWR